MSCKRKLLLLIIAMLVMFVGLMTMPAMADDNNYRELPTQKNIDLDKANWSIKFNIPIDQTTVNESNIYIVNQKDQTRLNVGFELSADKKTIYVIPKTLYATNTTYRLFIEKDIRSDTNPVCYLTQKMFMTFTTINISKTNQPSNVTVLDKQSLSDLEEVSNGLKIVSNKLKDQAEVDVVLAIKNNIDRKIADPTFDHTAEIDSILDMYRSLNSQQREELQDAILYDITLQSLMRLAEYFGFD